MLANKTDVAFLHVATETVTSVHIGEKIYLLYCCSIVLTGSHTATAAIGHTRPS